MSTIPSQAAEKSDRWGHEPINGLDIGAGPGAYCRRCGMRAGVVGWDQVCGAAVQRPMGVRSEYDPLA